MKGKIGIFSWLIIGVAILVVIASLAVVVVSSSNSKERIERSRRRYLKHERMLKDAREEAKRLAQLEVKKSIQRQKRDSEKPQRKASSVPVRAPGGLEKLLQRSEGSGRYERTPMPTGEMTAEDLDIVEVAQEASDERDFETVKDVADAALKSKDPRVRFRAVETLGSFGEVALPYLADFLRDDHPEVANLAADRFDLGVQDLRYEAERVAVAKLGMMSINDEDRLRGMAAALRMSNDQLSIISALADVIMDGNRNQREAAKEAYELETGEAWVDLDTADRWLQENYEPPPNTDPEEDEPDAPEEPDEEDDGSGEEEFDDTNEEEQGEYT